MGRNIKCPKCKSLNVQLLGNKRKKAISVGKGIIGLGLTSLALHTPVGIVAGLIGNKGKYDLFCEDCGHCFSVK